MNEYQNRLYDDLMQLVSTNDAFYYVDHRINDAAYRVFSYRLASYTDFLLSNALECRGHMFRHNHYSGMDELVSLPFEKFFNLNENPLTMDLDLSQVEFIHDKRDGSLISTYYHEGMLRLKSKTSISSDQALDAMRLLNTDSDLHYLTTQFTEKDCTVTFEYTSPDNRIVLPYNDHELRVLGARSNLDGSYVDYEELYDVFGDYMVDDHTHAVDDPAEFVETIPEMTGIEGFVIGLASGQRIKIKTTEYLTLHRAKDSINSNKRLFEAALNDCTDDLRSLFVEDEQTIQKITEMEQLVGAVYNRLVKNVETYYNTNKELDRKSYAIKGQQELDRKEFSLAMMLYSGKTPDYKQMLMKNFKDYVEDDEDE